MPKRRRPKVPAWARRERLSDMAWIAENVHVFWPAAQAQYQTLGGGALVVDTTVRPTGAGHPFTYYPQAHLDQAGDEDARRMVSEYDPSAEMVVALLKPKDRMSVYRVRVR
jgi:hypothetical protein